MLSRVAESLYWMARYVERAENIARFLDVTNHLSLDTTGSTQTLWEALVAVMAGEEDFSERYDSLTEENVIAFLVCDASSPLSLISCLKMARENARGIREIIPAELWLQINTLYHLVREASESGVKSVNEKLFQNVKMGAHLFFGIMGDCMSHGEAYWFALLGRYMERADKISRIIDVKYFILLPYGSLVGSPIDGIQWMAVLKSVSAYEMYCKKLKRVEPTQVIDFLLKDENFPRSILFCLMKARHYLEILHQDLGEDSGGEAIMMANRLSNELINTTTEQIIGGGLHEYIDRLQRGLNDLHGEVCARFF